MCGHVAVLGWYVSDVKCGYLYVPKPTQNSQELAFFEFFDYNGIKKSSETCFFHFFSFLSFLKFLKSQIFKFLTFLRHFITTMFVKTYENLDSSALFRIRMGENVVFVTYNSNIDKEYEFSCQNCDKFAEKVSKTLKNKESLGKLLHKTIKEGELVPTAE